MNRKHFFSMLICVSMAVSGCGTKKMIDVSSIPSEDAEQTVTDEQKINVLLEETPAELFVYDITDGELYIYGMYDSGLESLVIPNEIEGCPVTEFDANYIADNVTIHTVVIPPNVTRLACSFQNMDALETLLVQEGNDRFTSRDAQGKECNAIMEKGTGMLVYGCRTSRIPEGVTTIGEYAFFVCAGLTEIELPNTVTTIEDAAFSSTQLHRIEIPDSVTSLGGWTFSECYELKEVILSENITEIQPYTFVDCESLKEIVIPEGVVRIGEGAFKESALERITLPESLDVIEDESFFGCDNLMVTAPKGSYAEAWAKENGYSVSGERTE